MAVSTKGWGGPLTSNNMNQGGFPIAFSSQIGGYKSVRLLNDTRNPNTLTENDPPISGLYQIPDHILSENISKDDNTGKDALGQLWYVQEIGRFYQLVNWNNRNNANGWQKYIEIMSIEEIYEMCGYTYP